MTAVIPKSMQKLIQHVKEFFLGMKNYTLCLNNALLIRIQRR